jgi:1-acyl-sn-glycerol-3-phosphate acyltransferase
VSLLLLRLIVGLSYEVRGQHNYPQSPAIVALKHQSAWDTIAVWVILENPAIVLKQSLARIPVFGWYVKKGKAIVINRDAGSRAIRPMICKARLAAGEGRPIVIFPEGTRTSSGFRQPYQPGVAALYMQLGLPVVPAALNSGHFWGRHSLIIRPGRILVEFLTPIGPGLDRRVVLAKLESCIELATARLVTESNGIQIEAGLDCSTATPGT